jgi:hypothetical protein
MYLDLSEYPNAIEGDLEDQAEVIFWATSA